MPAPEQSALASPEGREIFAKLQWLMLFRVLMVTVLLSSTIVMWSDSLESLSDPLQIFLYAIIIGTYGLTLLYAFLLKRVRYLLAFAYAQLAGDVLISGALVLVTDGTDSVFTFLFSLSIINGAILVYRRGALVVATFSTLCFGLIVAHDYGLLSVAGFPARTDRTQLYYVAFIHFTTFYLVAILASYLAEQLRLAGRQLVEKQHDLATLKALNDNIVNSLATGLLTVSDEGSIIFFNPAAAGITGYSEQQVLLRGLGDVFPELADVLTFSSVGEVPERLETVFTRRDNARVFLEYQVSPLLNAAGEQVGKIVHFHDSTPMKTLESAVKRHERLAAVGQLAAAIAHEIRNPLASISGSAEILSSLPTTDESTQRLTDIMVRETDRLNDLITDFLNFARPRELDLAPTDLGQLVQETVEAFERQREDPGVTVGLEAVDDAWIFADSGQVRQVLWNLLHNAAQAMDGGGAIRVGVTRVQVAPDRPAVFEVTVRDEGPGVPDSIVHRIFDPFYTTRADGTGLGLAVVSRILEDHDGEIRVEPGTGAGAAFTFSFKAVDRPSSARSVEGAVGAIA